MKVSKFRRCKSRIVLDVRGFFDWIVVPMKMKIFFAVLVGGW